MIHDTWHMTHDFTVRCDHIQCALSTYHHVLSRVMMCHLVSCRVVWVVHAMILPQQTSPQLQHMLMDQRWVIPKHMNRRNETYTDADADAATNRMNGGRQDTRNMNSITQHSTITSLKHRWNITWHDMTKQHNSIHSMTSCFSLTCNPFIKCIVWYCL